MTVRDEAVWQEQLTELETDDLSRKFKDFLIFWMETTDKLLVDEPHSHEGNLILGYGPPVSKALELAEQTFGFLSVEWIAQMLLLICEHWEHGEELFEDLSFIEKRLVQQATAMKIADLQTAASIDTEG